MTMRFWCEICGLDELMVSDGSIVPPISCRCGERRGFHVNEE